MNPASISLRHYGASRGSHAHLHYQVLVALDGVLDLEIEGAGRRIAAGQGLLILPQERHDFESRAGSRCLVLDCADPDWAWRPRQPAHPKALAHLAHYLAEAEAVGIAPDPGEGALWLAQAWGASPGRRPATPALDWAALRRWAGPRLAGPLGVQDLARRAGLSASQFRARCLRETGASPRRWLQQKRLEQAALLLGAGLPVARVAARVGYDSPSALTAARRRERLAPAGDDQAASDSAAGVASAGSPPLRIR